MSEYGYPMGARFAIAENPKIGFWLGGFELVSTQGCANEVDNLLGIMERETAVSICHTNEYVMLSHASIAPVYMFLASKANERI